METTYRILIVEDVPTDAELNEMAIQEVLTQCVFERVETEADFLKALDEFKPDIIISDYSMPSFDGMTALRLTQERSPLTPFIIVTGSMNEDTAVDCMKAGATNYVIKQHIKRLGPAVLHAMEEKKIRMERLKAKEELKNSEEWHRILFMSSHDAIMTLKPPSWMFTSGNPATIELFGAKDEVDFISHAPWQLSPKRQPDGRPSGEKATEMIETAMQEGSHFFEWIHKRINGKEFPATVLLTRVILGDKTFLQSTVRDITERKQMEEKLKYLAYYDSLTGLPNRNLFIDRLKQGIARAERTSNIAAVLITDIDRFKSINDTYGTEVGDRVLMGLAERLLTAVRKGDTVARLGNDEFGISLLDIAHLDDVIPVMEKIMKYISSPLNMIGNEIALTFSTGISIYPHDNKNPQDLLKSAGLALGIAKKEGRKACRFYSKDMNMMATEMMLLEKQLVAAIKNDEFILHYQPYWDITTKKMVGMEALMRWQSKDKGLVSPGKFIPVLEDTGMIIEVGEWILREVMRQVKEWQDQRYPVVPVSVNMSLVQFRQKDLAEMVKRIMGECGFYPSLLTLEITESAFMQDIEFTRSVLTKMKEIGCSVSIDDFGTGYSSLAYLKRLPIDNLKIDISFIREMVKDPDSASIVMAIINMAHTLQLKTIAEGIETEEQWNFLRLLRCDMGQGFYLSKPLPAEDVERFFKQQ